MCRRMRRERERERWGVSDRAVLRPYISHCQMNRDKLPGICVGKIKKQWSHRLAVYSRTLTEHKMLEIPDAREAQ